MQLKEEDNIMSRQYKRYIERSDLKGATHLEIRVNYNIGGMSYFSGRMIPRGYYLSITPVNKTDRMISFTAFTGQSKLLFETARFSAKQFESAKEMAKDFEEEMIDTVVVKNQAA